MTNPREGLDVDIAITKMSLWNRDIAKLSIIVHPYHYPTTILVADILESQGVYNVDAEADFHFLSTLRQLLGSDITSYREGRCYAMCPTKIKHLL